MHHGIPSCQKASHVCHAEMGGAITDGGGEGGGERARTVDNKPEVTKLDYWGRQNQDVAVVTHLIRLTWSSSTAKLSNIGFNSAVPRTENWKSDGSSSVWLSLTCSLAEPRGPPYPRGPPCDCDPRRRPLLLSNEPASTQSKSSDDTDAARLIFTLDSPSSPLRRRVYLPAQLESGEDRQTDEERGGI